MKTQQKKIKISFLFFIALLSSVSTPLQSAEIACKGSQPIKGQRIIVINCNDLRTVTSTLRRAWLELKEDDNLVSLNSDQECFESYSTSLKYQGLGGASSAIPALIEKCNQTYRMIE